LFDYAEQEGESPKDNPDSDNGEDNPRPQAIWVHFKLSQA
jgi:hypothetical protein